MDTATVMPMMAEGQSTTLGFVPKVALGATSPGGLALPDAKPTAAQLYAPRGVWLDDELLVVADSGNHRILIWRNGAEHNGQAADVVLGQPDFFSEGPKLLHLPTGVAIYEGKLFVGDAWHHRILVWDRVPTQSNTPPDWALGQVDLNGVDANAGGAISASGLYWPYGFGYVGGRFYVADTGNRRVLGWHGLPQRHQPADWVLGQADFAHGEENRGGDIRADSFRWPHAIAGDAERVFVADAGNHRVLGWSPHPTQDQAATMVLGQADFEHGRELPYIKQGPSKLRFPYCLSQSDGQLAVADTANNRVLLWSSAAIADVATPAAGLPAEGVIGQNDFDANGENHWKAVAADTLCWPYGVCLHKNKLAIADSGNNRVMIWERQ